MTRRLRLPLALLAADAVGCCAVLPVTLGLLGAVDSALWTHRLLWTVLGGLLTGSAASWAARRAVSAPLEVLRGALRKAPA